MENSYYKNKLLLLHRENVLEKGKKCTAEVTINETSPCEHVQIDIDGQVTNMEKCFTYWIDFILNEDTEAEHMADAMEENFKKAGIKNFKKITITQRAEDRTSNSCENGQSAEQEAVNEIIKDPSLSDKEKEQILGYRVQDSAKK